MTEDEHISWECSSKHLLASSTCMSMLKPNCFTIFGDALVLVIFLRMGHIGMGPVSMYPEFGGIWPLQTTGNKTCVSLQPLPHWCPNEKTALPGGRVPSVMPSQWTKAFPVLPFPSAFLCVSAVLVYALPQCQALQLRSNGWSVWTGTLMLPLQSLCWLTL